MNQIKILINHFQLRIETGGKLVQKQLYQFVLV